MAYRMAVRIAVPSPSLPGRCRTWIRGSAAANSSARRPVPSGELSSTTRTWASGAYLWTSRISGSRLPSSLYVARETSTRGRAGGPGRGERAAGLVPAGWAAGGGVRVATCIGVGSASMLYNTTILVRRRLFRRVRTDRRPHPGAWPHARAVGRRLPQLQEGPQGAARVRGQDDPVQELPDGLQGPRPAGRCQARRPGRPERPDPVQGRRPAPEEAPARRRRRGGDGRRPARPAVRGDQGGRGSPPLPVLRPAARPAGHHDLPALRV